MSDAKFLQGKILAEHIKAKDAKTPLNEVEFSVYSQFGEDGILQFITHHLAAKIKHKIFVEIGVQNYTEANTRFLLENNGWQGFLVDACGSDMAQILKSEFYWRHNLHGKNAFVTAANINQILQEFSLPEEIGLLSLDIDGNDYWVLKNIQVLKPVIIIVEYNSFFGPKAPISIPYQEKFVWKKSTPAPYFGASLAAFSYLLENAGYELLGSTMAGNNAFFVRKDVNDGKLPAVACAEAYRQATFSLIPSTTPNKFAEHVDLLNFQQVINVVDNKRVKLSGNPIALIS